MVLPFLIGVALTVTLLGLAWITGLARERGVYTATLIAIALFMSFLLLNMAG